MSDLIIVAICWSASFPPALAILCWLQERKVTRLDIVLLILMGPAVLALAAIVTVVLVPILFLVAWYETRFPPKPKTNTGFWTEPINICGKRQSSPQESTNE